MQEPKYVFKYGGIYNQASGEIIPLDEPVMVFRGRDIHALLTIQFYRAQIQNEEHQRAVDARIEDFLSFRQQHSDRMKEPDTDLG